MKGASNHKTRFFKRNVQPWLHIVNYLGRTCFDWELFGLCRQTIPSASSHAIHTATGTFSFLTFSLIANHLVQKIQMLKSSCILSTSKMRLIFDRPVVRTLE